jgi:hypothetical protein
MLGMHVDVIMTDQAPWQAGAAPSGRVQCAPQIAAGLAAVVLSLADVVSSCAYSLLKRGQLSERLVCKRVV